MEVFDVKTAVEWFQLIEEGVPEDVALERLENEAKINGAPFEYAGCLNESNFNSRNLTDAEESVITMYCTEENQFYLQLNEDCRSRNWMKYVVYTSLLHSVCVKLRNKPIKRGDRLYRGLDSCSSTGRRDKKFCWPCFTSASTKREIALNFGETMVNLESKTGAPVKQFSVFFEYEILFSPFHIFSCKLEGTAEVYCSMQEPSLFFLSFPYYRGALLGAAVANCVGSSFEFQEPTMTTLIAFFEKIETDKKKTALRYVCDTSMTFALSKSLTAKKGLDLKNLSESFVNEYSADPNRKYGASVVTVLKELKGKDDLLAPARKQFNGSGSHGNGGAMRIAPAALYFFKEHEDKFNENVGQITRLTHSNIDGVNGAILQASAVKLALKFAFDGAWDKDIRNEYLEELIRIMKKVECITPSSKTPYCRKLMKVKDYITQPPVPATIETELGNGISALDSVPAAVYCFLRGLQPIPEIPSKYNSFERTIIYAISLGGDTDTIASMAGAIAGAYYGQDSITQRWRDACEAKAVDEAKRLAKLIHRDIFKTD